MEELQWANGYAFGTPTRIGLPATQLKQFLDTTGPLLPLPRLFASSLMIRSDYVHPAPFPRPHN
jgi:multimeric flavodoxin WrbA